MRHNYINQFFYTFATVGVATGAAEVGLSIYKGVKAHSEDEQAKKEGAATRRPFYSIPMEYNEDKNIWEQAAGQGLSSAEKEYAGQQRERGLSSSLSALKQTGAGPNDFGGLSKIFDDSLNSQSVADAQQHMQNIGMFTKANEELAGQKGIQFGINELQPYESKLKEIQDRRIAAQTNENNAINEGVGALSAVGTGLQSMYATRNPAGAKPAATSSPVYSIGFGLTPQDTSGGGAGSIAAGYGSIDPNSAPQLVLPAGQQSDAWLSGDQDMSTLE